MNSKIKKLIEEIDALTEDELVDDFDGAEISEEPQMVEPEVEEQPELSRTEELDAKTKISRALDLLKTQINDFKEATIIEISSLDQMNLVDAANKFDETVAEIENILDGSTGEVKQEEELETEEEPEIEEQSEETEEEPGEPDFEEEAKLDLLNNEE